jgi:hypothetical protein
VTVYLALDLVLKHAPGLGQLTHHNEDLAAVEELAHPGMKGNLLTDDEFVCWQASLPRPPGALAGAARLPGAAPAGLGAGLHLHPITGQELYSRGL